MLHRKARWPAVVAVVLGSCANYASTAPPVPAPDAAPPVRAAQDESGFSDEPVGRFSKDRAMAHVRVLADDVGLRARATDGERRGARYIADEFRALGYEVNIQKFDIDGGVSRNVVAWWPGARRYPVVVGAHMDTVPDSPGANDNASGVAVVLEVARLVAGKQPAKWLRFVAFGAEEYGVERVHHVGSQVFVNRLGAEGQDRLGGMVSVDMIADGRPLLTGTSGIGPDPVARAVFDAGESIGVAMSYMDTCDCSDNGPFEHAGIAAAYLWSGRVPEYHSPDDTVANMIPRDLMRTGRVVRAFVLELDADVVRRWRRAD